MTQSLSHIMLGYSGSFHLCICISLSATCTESYKPIFYSLTTLSLPSPPPTAGRRVDVSGGDSGGSTMAAVYLIYAVTMP